MRYLIFLLLLSSCGWKPLVSCEADFKKGTLEEIKDSFPVEFTNTLSDYFLLETEIIIENNKLIGQTIMHRKDGKITIMNRSYHQAP